MVFFEVVGLSNSYFQEKDQQEDYNLYDTLQH